jgi:hypothetical protein
VLFELLGEQPDGLLELLDRGFLDAGHPDRAVQPGVDLAVAQPVAAVQLADEAAALAP